MIVVISDITLEELSLAPSEVKSVVDDIESKQKEFVMVNEYITVLANQYIKYHAIPASMLADALHIACATFYDVDILISWNFKHIVNFNRIRKVNSVNVLNGFKPLEIRSPREVIYD